jgi:hypothetical protein
MFLDGAGAAYMPGEYLTSVVSYSKFVSASIRDEGGTDPLVEGVGVGALET